MKEGDPTPNPTNTTNGPADDANGHVQQASASDKEQQKRAKKECYRYIYRNCRNNNDPHRRGRKTGDGAGLGAITFNLQSSDFAQPWFHKHATRNAANTLLQGQADGSFLIRPSSQR